MKKVLYYLLCVIVLLTSVRTAKATVANYTFASSGGNYSVITGTTLFSGAWDDNASSLLTIPFSFTYNNIAYTTISVSTNGFITMGAVPATVYCGLQTSALNSIAGYGTDLVGSSASTIKYTTRGATPNRQFVVQFTDCDHYNNANADHWTFQIILNETSNTVQVVWGTSTDAVMMGANTCSDAATESGNVGLLGSTVTDFNIRSVTNATNTWATSAVGGALTAVCNMSSSNIPASGLTYTWTPGATVAMSYTSSTTAFLNNGQSVPRSSTSNQIIQVRVVTTGSLTPFNVTSISLSTAGCTNAALDISNAKIYFTGISSTFSTTAQFGATAASPNGAYTTSGSATLSEGTNYFWVTYDVTAGAAFGDVLSGCCTQLIGSGTMGTRVPTVTCPAGTQTISQIGVWTAVGTLAPHSNLGHMLLLSDGTVICKSSSGGSDGYGNVWDRLTPNSSGSYVNGTWSSLPSMVNTRLFFSSQLLMDGRLYVAGGEYGTGGAAGEVYNPVTNTWTLAGSPGGTVSDANSEILPDGRVLQALVQGSLTGTTIYNPVSNTYTAGPTALGIHNESAWVKLPDNSILYVNRLSTASERYIPATNTWVADGTVPVALYDPYGDETGAGFLLPDGRAFFLGSLGHTAYYTPSGTSSPGTWAAGPDIPSAKGTPDAAAAMMANGKILCAVSPVPTSANHFPSPTTFYEFDYLSNSFALVNAPGGVASLNMGCYQTNFVELPDGSVMYGQNQTSTSNQYYIYTPSGAQLASGQPTINNIIQNGCTSFTITGTLFNGISEGAAYGDDGQMASNYPIIRLTAGANVYYARTFNWNRTGVRTGALADTTQFTTPAGLPAGTYSLFVTANGISSNPVSFVFNPVPTLSSTLTPPAICTNTAFTYTPTSASGGATFTWTRAAVAGISNSAITTPQSSNPNEVLINTTSNSISVVYSYTISANGCNSNIQSVTVVVNPIPTAATITAGGSTTFCSGGSVLLSGNTNAGTWSIGGGTTSTLSATASGNYFVSNSNACGSATSNHITVTVNPLPVVTAANVSGCTGTSISLSGSPAGGTWSVANPYSGSSTTYTHTYTDVNGCTNTSAAANITVNPLPTVTASDVSGCAGASIALSGTPVGGTWSVANPYSGSSTTYTHTFTDVNGCTNTSSAANITVNPLPTVTASDVNGCAGASIALSGTPVGGTWSVANPYSGSSTTYTHTFTDVNGCTNTSAAANIMVNPLPTVTASDVSGCAGASIALAGTPVGGTWSVANPYSGSSTTYTHTYTDVNGCTNTSAAANITVNPLPTVTASDVSGCAGASIALSGTPVGGTWSVANPYSGSSTTYTHTYTDVNGCTNTSAAANITVNPLPTVTASDVSGCAGASIALSGTPVGGTWSVANPYSGSSTTYTHTYTDVNGCTNTSAVANITVNPLPTVTAGTYSDVCDTTTSPVALNGTPSGGTWSGTGVSGSNFIPASAGTGTWLLTYSYTDPNGCSASATASINVINCGCVPPAQPGTTTGASFICKSTTGNAFSVSPVNGATTYTWTVPIGAIITSGQGSTAIAVSFSSTQASGNLCVTASNACGSSPSSCRALTVVTVKPATPASITGTLTPCAGISGVPYSCPVVPNAQTYIWVMPTGATIASGANTNSITVDFASTFVSGYLRVSASNCSGTSGQQIITVYGKPSTPTPVTGPVEGVCAGSTNVSYSITSVAAANTYTWTAPPNATISSGQGTISVLVNFSASFTTGNLSVTAGNVCGSSAARIATIHSVPVMPGTISGAASVCAHQAGIAYSIAAVTGATSYLWTAPAGCTIASGQGGTAITVNWGTASGTLSVKAQNACGYSGLRNLTVLVTCRNSSSDAEPNFTLAPNPAGDYVVCSYQSTSERNVELSIIDMMGRIIQVVQAKSIEGINHIELNTSAYAKGIYLVSIKSKDDFSSVQRLVIE